MEEKENLQDKEMQQVAGGLQRVARCPSCTKAFNPHEDNGTVKVVDHGCGKDITFIYICPNCGHQWESSI